MRRLPLACLLAVAALAAPAAAQAEQSASLTPSAILLEQPEGRPWAIDLGLDVAVATPDGGPPSPLRNIEMRFPAGATINDRGYPECTAAILERQGPVACPKGSVVGTGKAIGDARPLLANPIDAAVKVYVGPRVRAGRTLIFVATVTAPVQLQLIMEGVLRETPGRYGYRIAFQIPQINTIPGSPPAAISGFDVVVGAERKGRAFIEAPTRCPRGGWPFTARFGFADGSSNTSSSSIGCELQAAPAGS